MRQQRETATQRIGKRSGEHETIHHFLVQVIGQARFPITVPCTLFSVKIRRTIDGSPQLGLRDSICPRTCCPKREKYN